MRKIQKEKISRTTRKRKNTFHLRQVRFFHPELRKNRWHTGMERIFKWVMKGRSVRKTNWLVSWVTGTWERSTRRPKLLWVIRISAPNFAAYGAGSMREALSGKLIHWSALTRKYLWIDSFIILNVVQYRKERNISFLLDSK